MWKRSSSRRRAAHFAPGRSKQIAAARPEDALKHPNWTMGQKITIDSATMMNKGLELIEAFHLFKVEADQLSAIIHPQSIIHALVYYTDGSVIAQASLPDMRTPIAYSLAWPERLKADFKRLDLATAGNLTFEEPDETRFPALKLAKQTLKDGGAAPTVLNAANEVAVEAFSTARFLSPASPRWSSKRSTRRRPILPATLRRTASKKSCTSMRAPARSRNALLDQPAAGKGRGGCPGAYLSMRRNAHICGFIERFPISFHLEGLAPRRLKRPPARKFRLMMPQDLSFAFGQLFWWTVPFLLVLGRGGDRPRARPFPGRPRLGRHRRNLLGRLRAARSRAFTTGAARAGG